MRVADAFNEKVAKLASAATLCDAAELLSATQSSELMVVDGDDNLLGVVSEGDLVRAVMPSRDEVLEGDLPLLSSLELIAEKGSSIKDRRVTEIMITDPITMSPEDPLLKAAQIMDSRKIRRLPVVDAGRLVGTLSRADICLHVIREQAD
ncbi:MAG: CBS domain-containing protein [Actinobacteria bacterium]|nr:CBS domain-containing protein [Actinomycetota bacterium]MBU1944170.1 CBS domain-containing protein [Actinomycetota bacterium]MBU2687489.1 CBS domain-containing protein [Actinomycetota bacterium]